MIDTLYIIPYYRYSVTNWQEKKMKLQNAMKQQVFTRNAVNNISFFESDRSNPRDYVNDFLYIFSEELQEFGKELNLDCFKVEDIWTVQYKKGDHHAVHNHGTCNLSAILYLDYDEQEHTPTHFVVGQDNFKNTTEISSPYVREGDIVMFPSNLLHFTSPNTSDKVRRVVSFDITYSKKLNV
jgi:hypothetical protein